MRYVIIVKDSHDGCEALMVVKAPNRAKAVQRVMEIASHSWQMGLRQIDVYPIMNEDLVVE